jgi:polyphosphate kinase
MVREDLNSPELFINRELSWLEFNERVLQEGLSEGLPLLERLKFLSIVSSNLDEFFLIRVAGLRQQRSSGVRRRDPSGLTPTQQLGLISKRVHRMISEQAAGIRDVFGKLEAVGLRLLGPGDLSPAQKKFVRSHFSEDVAPVLTPLGLEEPGSAAMLPSLQLNVAALIKLGSGEEASEKIVAFPVPGLVPRFITIPAEQDVNLVPLEDVIAAHMGMLCPGADVLATAVFRITRDADVAIQEDEASDLLQAVEMAVLARRRRAAVRLKISAGTDKRIKKWLTQSLELENQDVYETDGLLDATGLMEIANRPGFEQQKLPDWPPQPPRDLIGSEDLWETLRDHDVMLFHPYESFEPVLDMVTEAAEDPNVLAIKQTLYRTSGDSPIVRALARAAESGKEVTVLIELKARFDEARNVQWARRLEDVGCHVVYGIAGHKTHCKALLIVRREGARIRRYVHLSTGNYNERTALLYSDIGLMTCDRDVAAEVAALFNLLTGYSEAIGWSTLTIAPAGLRKRFVDLIDREIRASTMDRPGMIMAKVNSLQDKQICQALYRASQAGVKVMLNVRGICCLRPVLKGVSENIEVRSVVDRFLEHARIFYFRNGGHEEVYLSSADWMPRNLDRRLELLFPLKDPNLVRRAVGIIETLMADNVKAYRLLADGTYERVRQSGRAMRAQETFYQEALAEASAARRAGLRFRPLTRPQE